MTAKSAGKKTRGNQHSYTPEQVAHFKQEVLEKIPQGWTLREIFAQAGMCNLSFLFTKLLPGDKAFIKQYARAMELRNDYWAEEMVQIADDRHLRRNRLPEWDVKTMLGHVMPGPTAGYTALNPEHPDYLAEAADRLDELLRAVCVRLPIRGVVERKRKGESVGSA